MMLNNLIRTIVALLLLAAGSVAAEQTPTIATVTFTKAVGSYLYIRADVADKEVWIATLPSRVQVNVGEQVEYIGGAVMKNFYSKAMDRTFDAVVFVDNIRNISNPDPIQNKPIPEDDVHAKLGQPVTQPKAGEIQPVVGGETVASLLNQGEAMRDKLVSVRAKIMKVSPNIMGKNWVTLQDGTGSAPNDKLIVTTQERVFPGDVVTVKGRVKTDVDLGGGYKYAVMLEQGQFTLQP